MAALAPAEDTILACYMSKETITYDHFMEIVMQMATSIYGDNLSVNSVNQCANEAWSMVSPLSFLPQVSYKNMLVFRRWTLCPLCRIGTSRIHDPGMLHEPHQ